MAIEGRYAVRARLASVTRRWVRRNPLRNALRSQPSRQRVSTLRTHSHPSTPFSRPRRIILHRLPVFCNRRRSWGSTLVGSVIHGLPPAHPTPPGAAFHSFPYGALLPDDSDENTARGRNPAPLRTVAWKSDGPPQGFPRANRTGTNIGTKPKLPAIAVPPSRQIRALALTTTPLRRAARFSDLVGARHRAPCLLVMNRKS